VELAQFVVKCQPSCAASQVSPNAHSRHAFERCVQGVARNACYEAVQFQIRTDEGIRLASQNRPVTLLQCEM